MQRNVNDTNRKKVIESLQGLRNWVIIFHTPNEKKVIHTHLTNKEAGKLFIKLNSVKRNMDTWYQMKTLYE